MIGKIVRTTEALGGIDGNGEYVRVPRGELVRVEAPDDKPNTYLILPVDDEGNYDPTADWCEAGNVLPSQWEEVPT